MKNLKLLLVISSAILVALGGCKKDVVPTPVPPPAAKTVTVKATIVSGSGSVNPTEKTLTVGASTALKVNPSIGFRLSTATSDNGTKLSISGDLITMSDVLASTNVSIKLTDSLTSEQLAAETKLIVANDAHWGDVADSDKVSGAKNPPFSVYQAITIPACAQDAYTVYHADGTYESHSGAHPCDGSTPNGIIESGTWQISYNGKSIEGVATGLGNFSDQIDSLSNSTIITENFNAAGKGYDYKIKSVHK
jgi:hypothetical protein